jgi:hypothetical protein
MQLLGPIAGGITNPQSGSVAMCCPRNAKTALRHPDFATMVRRFILVILALALAAAAQQQETGDGSRSRSSLLGPLFKDVPPAPPRAQASQQQQAKKATLVFDSINVRNNRASMAPTTRETRAFSACPLIHVISSRQDRPQSAGDAVRGS